MITLYGIELVSPSGDLLADVSAFATTRTWDETRNDADNVTFTLPLVQFEAYCAEMGIHPRTILRKNWTEARIKRGEKYLASGVIQYMSTSLTKLTIDIKATGILNVLKKRRTGELRIFTATEATDIAWTAIDESQSKPNGNLYITQGPHQVAAGPHDETYQRTILKDLLQNLTTDETSPFDFEFTYDKQFNTYAALGGYRPDVVFEWGVNIIDATVSEDSVDQVNSVMALGAGFGSDAQSQYFVEDIDSQADTFLTEDVITSNATDNSDGGLTNVANAYLAAWSRGVTLVDVTVDGSQRPFVTDYGIGDIIRIDLSGHPWLDGVIGLFRIEARSSAIGDDDTEPVVLTVSV
jgi:hypothetical protein